MNKKIYIILFLTIILIPTVLADLREGVEETLGYIFGTEGDMVYVTAALWIILFYAMLKSVEKVITESRGMAVLISIIIASLGIRYMPEEYYSFLGSIFMIIFMLLLPYIVGAFVANILRRRGGVKIFIVLLFYGLWFYYLTQWEIAAGTLLDETVNWMSEHPMVIIVVAVGIALFLRYLKRGFGSSGGSGEGGSSLGGPRRRGPFFSKFREGFGRGAGMLAGAGKEAGMAAAKSTGGWLARKTQEKRMKRLNKKRRNRLTRQLRAAQIKDVLRRRAKAGRFKRLRNKFRR